MKEIMTPVSTLHLGDSLVVMNDIADNSFDLTVTSPPYDNLRTYSGSLIWNDSVWKEMLKELYRVTAEGGVVVWIVGDSTVKGSETGTSFKQALFAMECGFFLHDTMIWRKPNAPPQTKEGRRYTLAHEYMFVFSKGKPKTFNPVMQPCLTAGKASATSTNMKPDGGAREDRVLARKGNVVKDEKPLYSVVDCSINTKNIGHPAAFPESLCETHILSWSNEGDTVFDPFTGSGTTGKMAVLNGRNFVGVEKVEDYYNISKKRIDDALVTLVQAV